MGDSSDDTKSITKFERDRKSWRSTTLFQTEICKIRKLIECPICLEVLHTPVQLNCGHNYCRQCIADALEVNKKCPLCHADTLRRQIELVPDAIVRRISLLGSLLQSLNQEPSPEEYAAQLMLNAREKEARKWEESRRRRHSKQQKEIPAIPEPSDGVEVARHASTPSKEKIEVERKDAQDSDNSTLLMSKERTESRRPLADASLVGTADCDSTSVPTTMDAAKSLTHQKEYANVHSLDEITSTDSHSRHDPIETTISTFKPGDEVHVSDRCWVGINKPGGQAWIQSVISETHSADNQPGEDKCNSTNTNDDNNDNKNYSSSADGANINTPKSAFDGPYYTVKYVLDGRVDKDVPEYFIKHAPILECGRPRRERRLASPPGAPASSVVGTTYAQRHPAQQPEFSQLSLPKTTGQPGSAVERGDTDNNLGLSTKKKAKKTLDTSVGKRPLGPLGDLTNTDVTDNTDKKRPCRVNIVQSETSTGRSSSSNKAKGQQKHKRIIEEASDNKSNHSNNNHFEKLQEIPICVLNDDVPLDGSDWIRAGETKPKTGPITKFLTCTDTPHSSTHKSRSTGKCAASNASKENSGLKNASNFFSATDSAGAIPTKPENETTAPVCILCTNLNERDEDFKRVFLDHFQKTGVPVSEGQGFGSSITHLIGGTIEPGSYKNRKRSGGAATSTTATATTTPSSDKKPLLLKNRTMKALLAIMKGIPIVSSEWLHDCVLQDKILPIDRYEVSGVSKKSNLSGRMSVARNDIQKHGHSRLFTGLSVWLAGAFPLPGPARSDLTELLLSGGARLHSSASELVEAFMRAKAKASINHRAVSNNNRWNAGSVSQAVDDDSNDSFVSVVSASHPLNLGDTEKVVKRHSVVIFNDADTDIEELRKDSRNSSLFEAVDSGEIQLKPFIWVLNAVTDYNYSL